MDWQKHSTGKVFDRISGHGFIVGCRTVDIMSYRVKNKSFSLCNRANSLNATPEDHDCQINWEDGSGGREAGVALELCISIHDHSNFDIFIEQIVSDDDSTMRAHLQHDGKCKLPPHIPIPTFLTEPSHRIKVMSTPIFELAQGTTKDPRKCKKLMRLG